MAKLEMTKMSIEDMIFWPFATGFFFSVCCLGSRLADKILCLLFLFLVTLIKIITAHKRMQYP